MNVASRRQFGRTGRATAIVAAIAAATVLLLPGILAPVAYAQPEKPLTAPVQSRRGITPADQTVNDVHFDQLLDNQIPLDLTFRDETGKTVKLRQYYGKKPVVMTMVFYSCTMLCNEVLNEAVRGFKELKFSAGKDFEVVVVSIAPNEGPDLAKGKKENYLKQYGRPGSEKGWHFLVTDKAGDDTNIKRLANAIGYHYKPDPIVGFAHPAGLVVATPEGRIARYFLNFPYEGRDLKFGLVEAGNNKVGSFVDQIAMLCFHYNPAVGKYTLSIMKVVRLAFCVTVLLMGIFLVVMVRRDQKHHEHWQADGTPKIDSTPASHQA